MRLARPAGAQLTYCTNIHPGETWAEVRAALTEHVPAVRQALGVAGPFGVGLRLSARAVDDLQDPRAFDELREVLAAQDLYVFTLNGFPFGAFHGVRVKEGVYEPDWRSPERRAYSDRLARLLAAVLPEGLEGSVSTVPGAFRPNAREPADVAAIVDNVLRHAATLWQIREQDGPTIALAPEPEPECFLQTTDEAISFLRDHLFAAGAVRQFAELTGLNRAQAEDALRRHLGVCFDVCHAAVEFEDVPAALRALDREGIRVPKVQLSAALRLDPNDPAVLERLTAFDDGVYLHQVVARRADGSLRRDLDIPQALQAHAEGAAAEEWRVHFHVPVFLAELAPFASTQDDLAAALATLRSGAATPHLEVETYTWDVLPARHRDRPVAEAIGQELQWVMGRLDG